MRIAVLSDIHSNLLALNLIANDLKKENVDKICCLGDYITDGENDNEVLSVIREIADYAILGNREKYILDYSPARQEYNDRKPISTTYHNLKRENFEYLKTLKDTRIARAGHFKILLHHGDKYYYDDCSIEKAFDELIGEFEFDICLFGHSHRHTYFKYKDRLFINPGSVGQPCDSPSYKYCILDVTDRVDVRFRGFNVEETFDELMGAYRRTDYYKKNRVWASLVLHTIRGGRDYNAPFLRKVDDRVKNADELTAEEFNKIWDETYDELTEDCGLRPL